MSLAWSQHNDNYLSKPWVRIWNHFSGPSLGICPSTLSPWVGVVNASNPLRVRSRSTPFAPSPKKLNRNRRPTDHGSFGIGCGVRTPGNLPWSYSGKFAEGLPVSTFEKMDNVRNLRWQREHLWLTSKNLPDRAPLPDKGKPVVRRGRKATDQISDLTAGLPEEE